MRVPIRFGTTGLHGLLLAAGVMTACSTIEASDWDSLKREIRTKFPDVPQIATDSLAAWLADDAREAPVLLDAREAEEYAVSHIPGALPARNRKAAEKALATVARDSTAARDARRPVVVYCSVGYRSSDLAEELLERGYGPVFNLEGSLFEWANHGHAVVRGDSVVTEVHPYDRDWGRFLEERYWPASWKKQGRSRERD